MTVDNPHVRRDVICPLCLGDKDDGLVACWPCYRKHLKGSDTEPERVKAERVIAERERVLAGAWWVQ
jgi:hypothetical protein